MYYFDNAATSHPKPPSVGIAVLDAINSLGNASRGAYSLSINASKKLFDARIAVSSLFNTLDPCNVSFTPNATYALNFIIKSLITKNDHVITFNSSHNSVLRPLYFSGAKLDIIDSNLNEEEYLDKTEKAITPNTKMLIVSHASNVTGDILNINALGSLCKKHNILFALDVAQTAGTIKIDAKKDNIDILAFTGHKGLLGPQGTGGIVLNTDLKFNEVFSGGSGFDSYSKHQPLVMPEIFEIGTSNVHSIAGLLAGIDFVNSIGIEKIEEKENNLLYHFYKEVSKIKNIKIYGDFSSKKRCPILLLNIGEIYAQDLSDILFDQFQISVRAGSHCSPLIHESLKTTQSGAVRFSFSYFNEIEEIDYAISALNKISTY